MKKRTVIIHRHLFKNAGTTFDSILKNNFGEAFCDHRDDMPMRKEGEKYLINYLNDHPEIKALSSHHIWFQLSRHSNFDLIPVMFLRHPIERISSVYNFERIQQSNSLGAVMAKKMNFREYVAWRMRGDVPYTIRNFQTRYMAGVKATNPLTNQHFKLAVDELKRNKFVGIVDLYDESMNLFDIYFKDLGFGLDLSYKPQNVHQSYSDTDYEARAITILDKLGDLADEVIAKNQFDLDLYKTAKELLRKKNNNTSVII
ncbi:MAG: sulfotransferase family 2 domain-containing protein [Bacteroidota bacterium]|nr:sulfotransferase family 2 domain-containing protein [Bacteroidota bacterium]